MEMKDFGVISSSKAKMPPGYKCSKCGATGVKLWHDVLDHQSLLCLRCTCEDQNKVRTPSEDGRSLYTEKIHYWYRSASMSPNHWSGYDPTKGIPSDAVDIRSEQERTNQIGWYVPAVPTKDDTFFDSTSEPKFGYDWWASLPFLAT